MPSRAGWSALVAAVATLVAGRVFGLVELYIFASALFIATVFGVLRVAAPLSALSVTRVARPEVLEVGDDGLAELEVSNTRSWRLPALRLWEAVGDDSGAPIQLAPLRRHRSVSAHYRVPTDRRGVVELGPLRVERTDLLGLARRATFVGRTDSVLVLPRTVDLAFPGLESRGALGEHLRLRAWSTSGTEFHAQREYVPGDDLRRINWKSSARSGELIVRESAREGVRQCVVVLDLATASYADELDVETAVSTAASVVRAAEAAGVATRFLAHGADLRGLSITAQTTHWLATATTTLRTDPLVIGAHSDGLSLVVAITGAHGEAAIDSIRSQCGPDDTVVTVRADATSSDTDRSFAIHGTDLDSVADAWHRLVGR